MVGVSDHLALLPDGRLPGWAMDPAGLGRYIETADETRSSSGAHVRVGVEADFLPETAAHLAGLLESQSLDFVIGAVHFVHTFPVDTDRTLWGLLSPDQQEEVWEGYWALVSEMARSGIFDIAAHLDLPKRFGFRPRHPVSPGALRALDDLAAAGMAIELNTAGWFCEAQECYPSPALLQEACQRELPLVITADAHRPEHIDRAFDRARRTARTAGYTTLAIFEGRRRGEVPLL